MSGGRRAAAVETAAIVLVCFLAAGFPPPDVNEPNYLGKAKHFWDPGWAAGDIYLESADTHLVFYVVYGWITRLVDLEAAAWIGRLATWALMGLGWVALGRAVGLPIGGSVLAAALFEAAVHYGQLSGEWVVGGCEAKGFSYVAVFMALAALVRGRPQATVLWLAMATAWHVLVGGWTAIAVGMVWIVDVVSRRRHGRTRQQWRPDWRWLLTGLVAVALVGIGVWPVVAMNAGVPADVVREATRIYVFQRLPHHLLPASFVERIPWHAALLAVWAAAAWLTRGQPGPRRLNAVALAALGLSLTGFAIDAATVGRPDLRAALMRLYWFRSADALVPLATAVSLVALAASLRSETQRRAMYGGLAVVTVVLLGRLAMQHVETSEPRGEVAWNSADWRATCAWIRDNTPPTARLMTPTFEQTFKWYAGRAEVANWKETPQDARSIVEWWKRLRTIYGAEPGVSPWMSPWRFALTEHSPEALRSLAARYGATYVVTYSEPRLALPCEYRNNCYAVYRVGP